MSKQPSEKQAAEQLVQKIQHGLDSAEKFGWISEEEADRLLEEEITDKLQSAEWEAVATDVRYSAADVLQSICEE